MQSVGVQVSLNYVLEWEHIVLNGRVQKQKNTSIFAYVILILTFESVKKKKKGTANIPLMPHLTKIQGYAVVLELSEASKDL